MRAIAGKVVREVQAFHAKRKSVPLDRFRAGKEAKPVQPSHALVKSTSSLAVSENVTAGKDVSPVQSFHAYEKLVPLARFR